MWLGVIDDLAHGDGADANEVFYDSGNESPNAFGFAAVVSEGEFIEVALQMFIADGTMVGAKPLPFEVGECPVTNLYRIVLRSLTGRLHMRFVRSLAKRFTIIDTAAIRNDVGVIGNVSFHEMGSPLILRVGRMLKAHASVSDFSCD